MRSPSASAVDVRGGKPVFCSTIIPTIARPTLARAVESVLAQRIDGEDFEVIVVNDSGGPLVEADWQRSERIRVIATDRQERSIARNSGASLATGRYLHFLDDDDALLPRALQSFSGLSRQTDAAWLYGSYLTVDNDGRLVEEVPARVEGNIFAKLMVREAIPLQASLILRTAFVAAGGFDPAFVTIEDQHLERVLALTTEVAFTPAVVAEIRVGCTESSTNWPLYDGLDRRSFEVHADRPGARARIETSAGLEAYWYGRLSRAYLASALWNLRQGSFRAAARRLPPLSSFARCGRASPSYWRGLWHTGWRRIYRG